MEHERSTAATSSCSLWSGEHKRMFPSAQLVVFERSLRCGFLETTQREISSLQSSMTQTWSRMARNFGELRNASEVTLDSCLASPPKHRFTCFLLGISARLNHLNPSCRNGSRVQAPCGMGLIQSSRVSQTCVGLRF